MVRQSANGNLTDKLRRGFASDTHAPSRLERLRQQAIYQDARVSGDNSRESREVEQGTKHPANFGARRRLAGKTRVAVKWITPGGSPNHRPEKGPAEPTENAEQHLLSHKYKPAKRHADLGDRNAVHGLKRAVESGDRDAMVRLGRMYAGGRGINKDNGKALSLFRRAAERDHPDGIYCLAAMYWKGWGTRRDLGEAVYHFRRAGNLGHISAMNYLALAYNKGVGVAEDASEAAKWYRRAADRGSVHAQFQLGSMHLGGRGVTRDRVQAHAWLSLAAVNGKADAFDVRDRVAELMSPAEVLKARALALEMQQDS